MISIWATSWAVVSCLALLSLHASPTLPVDLSLEMLQRKSTQGSLRLFVSFLWVYPCVSVSDLDVRVKGAEYFKITVCLLLQYEVRSRKQVDEIISDPSHCSFCIFQLLPYKKCLRNNETKTIRHTRPAHFREAPSLKFVLCKVQTDFGTIRLT